MEALKILLVIRLRQTIPLGPLITGEENENIFQETFAVAEHSLCNDDCGGVFHAIRCDTVALYGARDTYQNDGQILGLVGRSMKQIKILKIHPRDEWYDCRDILEGQILTEYQGNLYVDKRTLSRLKKRGFGNPIVLSKQSQTEEVK